MPLDLALLDAGYNVRINRYGFSKDPRTGDVAFDETQAFAVVTSVVDIRGTWWADLTHGSNVSAIKQLTSRTPSQVEATALDALTPLEQANLIAANPVALASRTVGAPNRLRLDLTWSIPGSALPNRAKVQI